MENPNLLNIEQHQNRAEDIHLWADLPTKGYLLDLLE